MKRIPRNSVGLAGEFAVLSQLALHGYDAGMTLGYTKNIDILVYDPASKKRYEVEVKTNLKTRDGTSKSKLFGRFVTDWQMNIKHERISSPNLFYCFVNIISCHKANHTFRFFIVPSKVVATYVRQQHALWLKDNPAHRDMDRRLFRIGLPNETKVAIQAPLASKYENNWGFSSKQD